MDKLTKGILKTSVRIFMYLCLLVGGFGGFLLFRLLTDTEGFWRPGSQSLFTWMFILGALGFLGAAYLLNKMNNG